MQWLVPPNDSLFGIRREYVALWSLSNEFWYYVLFFALISVRKTPAYVLLIIAIFGLFLVAERHDAAGTHIGFKFFFFFAIWCCGVLVYAVVAPTWMWFCGFLASLAAVYVLSTRGLFPHWAAWLLSSGLVPRRSSFASSI